MSRSELNGSDLDGYSMTVNQAGHSGDSLEFPKAMKIKFIPPRPPCLHPCNSTPLFSSSSTLDSLGNPNQIQIMEKFRQAVFSHAASDPTRIVTPQIKSRIETHLLTLCPLVTTAPSHPTYASMILRAITMLGEESGSNENSISEFIKENYDSLPWAHSCFLTYHLKKLCESGEISVYSNGYYYVSIPEQASSGDKKKKQQKTHKRKQFSKQKQCSNESQKNDKLMAVNFQPESPPKSKSLEEKGEQNLLTANLQCGEKSRRGRGRPRKQKIIPTDENEEQRLLVVNLQAESPKPKNGVEKDEEKLLISNLQCAEKSRGRGRPRKKKAPKTKPMEEKEEQRLLVVDLQPEISPKLKSVVEGNANMQCGEKGMEKTL